MTLSKITACDPSRRNKLELKVTTILVRDSARTTQRTQNDHLYWLADALFFIPEGANNENNPVDHRHHLYRGTADYYGRV